MVPTNKILTDTKFSAGGTYKDNWDQTWNDRDKRARAQRWNRILELQLFEEGIVQTAESQLQLVSIYDLYGLLRHPKLGSRSGQAVDPQARPW